MKENLAMAAYAAVLCATGLALVGAATDQLSWDQLVAFLTGLGL